jgi:hypothetical protein
MVVVVVVVVVDVDGDDDVDLDVRHVDAQIILVSRATTPSSRRATTTCVHARDSSFSGASPS